MKVFDWDDLGVSLDIRSAISEDESFRVRMPKALNKLLPASMGATKSLTPGELATILALATLAVFGGLAAYAISKGYTVRRKGDEWVFEPPAK